MESTEKATVEVNLWSLCISKIYCYKTINTWSLYLNRELPKEKSKMA